MLSEHPHGLLHLASDAVGNAGEVTTSAAAAAALDRREQECDFADMSDCEQRNHLQHHFQRKPQLLRNAISPVLVVDSFPSSAERTNENDLNNFRRKLVDM